MGRAKKYLTESEKKKARREAHRKSYEAHRESDLRRVAKRYYQLKIDRQIDNDEELRAAKVPTVQQPVAPINNIFFELGYKLDPAYVTPVTERDVRIFIR